MIRFRVGVACALLIVLVLLGTGAAFTRAQAQGNIGGTLPPALASPYPPPLPSAYPALVPTLAAPPPVTSDLILNIDAPTFARRGEAVRLTYTLINAGPHPARGVTFIVVLPSGLRLSRVGAGSAWDCTIANATGWSLNKPVTVTCWRNDFLMAGVAEIIYIDADVYTSVLSRDMVATRAALLGKGVDLTPNVADWWPGVE